MADSEKAFTCSSSGCTMSFTNEDQLTVHKKKHDMILNLGSGSKNPGFVADQTPTPTRFIRNCEEVGLFQDLQNVNPFEETFRRAVESGNTGTLSVTEAGITDDTLHTPHIFPHIADVLSGSNQILSESSVHDCSGSISITEKSTERNVIIDAEVCSSVKLTGTQEQDLLKDKLTGEKNETLAENIINEVTDTPILSRVLGEQPSPQLSINGEEVQLLLKTADGKLVQLSAIPICDSTNIIAAPSLLKEQTVVIKTEPSLQCVTKVAPKKPLVSSLSLTKLKLKQALTKSTVSQSQKSGDNSGRNELNTSKKQIRSRTVEDQIKKREILERNRASSMRARAKRKAWIQQLERTVANVNETNVALQMEIKVLRTEVAKLKTILLAHKDCPVTKAMQKVNGIVLGSKLISLNSDLTTNPTTPIGISLKRTSMSSTEVPILPKKKLSLAPVKHPIIFPRVDCSANLTIPNATLIKSVPTLKIMGVGQLLAEKEETKQILIVQSPQREVENSPRQIIQINPNYDIDHGSTKTLNT
ncbi:PREDICTED: cyclic AMP-dependent transcription factor ATF-2 [Dufourea novaeangliae]|uniref:Cyclic AMP-dependent transcription factor ATF-2 n=1 Tax=Dufourea novaeangliae TaxID=178035 RepID=A0A154P7N2_DUFNO|nr:PREDICTED: cyclic AMP-dependent transcription factor ATF-2 [Dufourea novaeangliae]KZC07130.1 Cyclic AMP-dependent transcription factor ATF-2 [Dufourea novaeangliae]